jgi:hypothetical protein
VASHALEINFERRMAAGLTLNLAYARLSVREADFFKDEFDPLPTWRSSNDGRPQRMVATGLWEIPVGRGRHFVQNGPLARIFGGFQIGLSFEYQPGALLSWGNLFYYGNIEDINTGERTLDSWFNTANFERTSSKAPAEYHRRVFPTVIDGLRSASANQWNGNVGREFNLFERVRLQLRVDALNLANRAQFAAPDTNPLSSNFGKVTSQSNNMNRFIQLQGRIRF